jgi:hypothetical protein
MHHGASVCLRAASNQSDLSLPSLLCGTTQRNNLEQFDAIFHVKKNIGYVQIKFSTFKPCIYLISLSKFRKIAGKTRQEKLRKHGVDAKSNGIAVYGANIP